MTSTASHDPVRDRLRSSILLAVLLHALAFVALEIFLKLAPQRTPEYRGPLIVQLQELPAVQQARQAAPAQAAPAAAAPAQAAAAAPAVAAAPAALLPSGPPLRAAAPSAPAAAGPSGSPFRMEGAPAQAGQPRPAGQGFQVPTPEPTLPPAGTQAQGPALRAVAPGSGGQAAPAAPLEDLTHLDQALDRGSAARAGSGTGAGAAAGGAPAGAQSGAGQGAVSQEGISIVFDDPTLGREPTSTPPPRIPKWVSEAGLRLTQEISFVLTPQGVLHSVRTVKSSGYSDVDSAVLDAVRGWKFRPAPAGAGNIQGTVVYSIVPTVGPAR